MDLVQKDMGLFDTLGQRLNVPLEVSPLVLDIFRDANARYGSRAWSSMVVKRLEDDCGVDLRGSGFPEEMIDIGPKISGHEVVVRG